MQRLFNYAGKIIICTVILGISGCGSMMDKDGCALLAIKGKLDLRVMRGDSNCSVAATYHNLEKGSSVKPEIKMRYFDATGNTVGSNNYYFDEINPGRSQEETRSVNCNVAKIEVDNAMSCINSLRRNRCYAICGVDGQTYTIQ